MATEFLEYNFHGQLNKWAVSPIAYSPVLLEEGSWLSAAAALGQHRWDKGFPLYGPQWQVEA